MSDGGTTAGMLAELLRLLDRLDGHMEGHTADEQERDPKMAARRLDSACMVFIALGEQLKRLDRHTGGKLLAKYPGIDWRGCMGQRDVIAHDYARLDPDRILTTIRDQAPRLRNGVNLMMVKDEVSW